MKYFAYGSNMSILRLQARVPSARRLGLCTLSAHQLRFHKEGKDGSSKCDAYHTNNTNDVVMGSLFEIDENEKASLDQAEGLGYGYNIKTVILTNIAGEQVTAFTYYAIATNSILLPYSWYVNHVVIGALEVNVPIHYLKVIQAIKYTEDPDSKRDALERWIYPRE